MRRSEIVKVSCFGAGEQMFHSAVPLYRIVLSEMLASGRALYESIRVGKVERSLSDLNRSSAKKAKLSFKEREPWE